MNNNYDLEKSKRRNQIIYAIRNFLNDLGYTEVETPILVEKRVPEKTITLFETIKNDFYGDKKKYYLVPSPEVTMKKIIAKNKKSIFQISKCFRDCEVYTPNHNHEFTMLECYTVEANYMDSLELVSKLFQALPNNEILKKDIQIVTMQGLFERYLQCDLHRILANDDCKTQLLLLAQKNGLLTQGSDGYSVADIFNLLFISFIEPKIKLPQPVAIIDYPKIVATTAKAKSGTPFCERWELYVNGIELINCYTEEIDSVNLNNFFREENCENSDNEFLMACTQLGKCSGFAMGIDRLIAILFNCKTIEDIMIK